MPALKVIDFVAAFLFVIKNSIVKKHAGIMKKKLRGRAGFPKSHCITRPLITGNKKMVLYCSTGLDLF